MMTEKGKENKTTGPRMSLQTLRVLNIFIANPTSDHYGLEIAKMIGVSGGTLYPILARLESHGWLSSDFEVIDPKVDKRRPRRYYKLTGLGSKRAKEELQKLSSIARPALDPAFGFGG